MARRKETFATLLLGACLALPACAQEADEAKSATAAPYAKPPDWRSQCLGYFLIDTPAMVRPADHAGYEGGGYAFASPLSIRSSPLQKPHALAGHVLFGRSQLGESPPYPLRDFLDITVKLAPDYYNRILRAEYNTIRRPDDYAKEVQELKIKEPRIHVAWRVGGRFEFLTRLHEDGRKRIILGRMSDDPDKDKGSAALATELIESLWSRYRPRRPDEFPAEAGLCTPYGFVADTKAQRESEFKVWLPYRSESQPTLIYTISIARGLEGSERLEDLSQPWRETREEAKQRREESKRKGEWISIGPGSIVEKYLEPDYLTVAGQRARLSGVKFRPAMDEYDYEVQIETLGDPADPLKPRIILMAQGLKASYYSGLKGQSPAPPLEQVIPTLKLMAQSMRVRLGAVEKP